MKANCLPAVVFFCISACFSNVVSSAQAGCDTYPLAISAATLANVSSGDIISNIFEGSQSVGTGWLTWSGKTGDDKLIKSLTGAGDSSTYVNPLNPNDRNLRAGDWVRSRSVVSDGLNLRKALDNLKPSQIIIPVWDESRGQGPNALYHISDFAVIQIISYDLSNRSITALFVGFASCYEVTRH